jgi:hypothetical protein
MEIAGQKTADSGPTRRRIARIDGRCKAALRVKAKVAGYVARLGAIADAVTMAAYQKAAELAVVAEDLRAKQLRGEPVDLSEMAKAQGLADRAERALGLDRKPAPTETFATIASRAQAEAGERRARELAEDDEPADEPIDEADPLP